MLCLTRQSRQAVIITTAHGEVIRVEVDRIVHRNKVRLLFEADKSVKIHREEIQVAIDAGEERKVV